MHSECSLPSSLCCRSLAHITLYTCGVLTKYFFSCMFRLCCTNRVLFDSAKWLVIKCHCVFVSSVFCASRFFFSIEQQLRDGGGVCVQVIISPIMRIRRLQMITIGTSIAFFVCLLVPPFISYLRARCIIIWSNYANLKKMKKKNQTIKAIYEDM